MIRVSIGDLVVEYPNQLEKGILQLLNRAKATPPSIGTVYNVACLMNYIANNRLPQWCWITLKSCFQDMVLPTASLDYKCWINFRNNKMMNW